MHCIKKAVTSPPPNQNTLAYYEWARLRIEDQNKLKKILPNNRYPYIITMENILIQSLFLVSGARYYKCEAITMRGEPSQPLCGLLTLVS